MPLVRDLYDDMADMREQVVGFKLRMGDTQQHVEMFEPLTIRLNKRQRTLKDEVSYLCSKKSVNNDIIRTQD